MITKRLEDGRVSIVLENEEEEQDLWCRLYISYSALESEWRKENGSRGHKFLSSNYEQWKSLNKVVKFKGTLKELRDE